MFFSKRALRATTVMVSVLISVGCGKLFKFQTPGHAEASKAQLLSTTVGSMATGMRSNALDDPDNPDPGAASPTPSPDPTGTGGDQPGEIPSPEPSPDVTPSPTIPPSPIPSQIPTTDGDLGTSYMCSTVATQSVGNVLTASQGLKATLYPVVSTVGARFYGASSQLPQAASTPIQVSQAKLGAPIQSLLGPEEVRKSIINLKKVSLSFPKLADGKYVLFLTDPTDVKAYLPAAGTALSSVLSTSSQKRTISPVLGYRSASYAGILNFAGGKFTVEQASNGSKGSSGWGSKDLAKSFQPDSVLVIYSTNPDYKVKKHSLSAAASASVYATEYVIDPSCSNVDPNTGMGEKSCQLDSDGIKIPGSCEIVDCRIQIAPPPVVEPPAPPAPEEPAPPATCDVKASPLFVHLGDSAAEARVTLSSPTMGVWFNTSGKREPNTKKRIMSLVSWPANPAKDQLIVLPTVENGVEKVLGAENLFGDQAAGPDKKVAANGFLALAKFDSNRDGKIDAKDAVFAKLRLWGDRNRNGVADPGELTTLAQAGIASIDVRSIDMAEEDAYGNQTKQRAYATMVNGKLLNVFDLYFRDVAWKLGSTK